MKFKISLLITIILLLIFTAGIVCADDEPIDDSLNQSTQDNITVFEDAIIADESSDEKQDDYSPVEDEYLNSSDSKKDIYITIYSPTIHPWTWADSDGDSGPGIDIWMDNYENPEYEPAGNTTIYFNGEIVETFQGIGHYLISDGDIWEKYDGKGYYTVDVVYSGDDNFNPASETVKVYISGYECSIDNNIVYLQLPSYVSGVLKVKANGKTYKERIYATYHRYMGYSSETYRVELEGLKSGESYKVKVKFKGNSEICDFTESFKIDYRQEKCPIDVFLKDYNGYYGSYETGDWSHYYYGKDNSVIFSVPKNIKNKVKVKIDGKKYKYSKIRGDISYYGNPDYDNAYKVKINNLKPGLHNIVVSYPGDLKYASNKIKTTLTVFSQTITIAMKDVTVFYTDNATFKAKVMDSAANNLQGEKVTFYVDGEKVASATTDDDGYATVTLSKTPNTYKVKAKCEGITSTNRLTVKHLLTLKTCEVRKSSSDITLQATLKKGKTPLEDREMTFKFNGKTYTAKTDSNGIAKVTIEKSVLKKLKEGQKIKYSATYQKDTVKKSAKVLK